MLGINSTKTTWSFFILVKKTWWIVGRAALIENQELLILKGVV